MQKHSTHVIDEQAVHFFKGSLPPDHWTVYDIRPDYGKDHKVELVEGGEHTGLSFWVQVKGQKKVKKLKDGTISFKLESKDLDYHTKLQPPVFLVVVDVTSRVGYWVFTQEYERTQLRNVAWRRQEYIQIRLPASNTLSRQKPFREAVGEAVRYMTRLAFSADLGAEKRRLEGLDPRFTVEITAGTDGRHYHFRSEEEVPLKFTYKGGEPGSGKIEEMLDRGVPVVMRQGEIVVTGSPLFEFFFELAGGSDVRLEFNKIVQGHANLLRTNEFGEEKARIDAIPCKIVCGRREATIEAKLPFDLLALGTTIPYDMAGTRPMSMPIDLSPWRGRRLLDLPYFEQLARLFVGLGAGERFAFECFAPGQRLLGGIMNFEEDQPYRGISFLVEMLAKARAVAGLRSANPRLPEDFESNRSLSEIQLLHDMMIGEGRRRPTPSASVRVTVGRGGLKRFLADVGDLSTLGTLNLYGDGSFPFLGEAIGIEALERVVTNIRLGNTRRSLRDQLERSSGRKDFHLDWEATEATETVLRERRAGEEFAVHGASKAG